MADKSLILLQQENLVLKKENVALQETVEILLKEVEKLRSIEKLPVITDPNVTKIIPTTEEKIIEDQITVLQLESAKRALSLEEVRALDLLIKNKRLLSPKDKDVEPDWTEVPPEDLLRIAGNVEVATPKSTESKQRTKTGKKNPVA